MLCHTKWGREALVGHGKPDPSAKPKKSKPSKRMPTVDAALEAGRRWRATRLGNNANSPLAARGNDAGRGERSRGLRRLTKPYGA